MANRPTFLIVGAGAVGAVYGRHLVLGGASVTFFVRAQYLATLRDGMTLYPLGEKGQRVRFDDYALVSRADEVATQSFDVVLICVSSDALRGPWLDELLEAVPSATIAAMLPTEADRAYLLERIAEERLINGIITFLSYPSPLPGERRDEPGIAYWFPPVLPSLFQGPPERVAPIVAALRAGGCPARRRSNVIAEASFGVAMMMPQLAALETVNFSFTTFRSDPELLARATRASDEALEIVAARLSMRPPRTMTWFNRPLTYRWAMGAAAGFARFDIETYIGFHFHKVRGQTRLMLEGFVEDGEARGMQHDALSSLLAELAP